MISRGVRERKGDRSDLKVITPGSDYSLIYLLVLTKSKVSKRGKRKGDMRDEMKESVITEG